MPDANVAYVHLLDLAGEVPMQAIKRAVAKTGGILRLPLTRQAAC